MKLITQFQIYTTTNNVTLDTCTASDISDILPAELPGHDNNDLKGGFKVQMSFLTDNAETFNLKTPKWTDTENLPELRRKGPCVQYQGNVTSTEHRQHARGKFPS